MRAVLKSLEALPMSCGRFGSVKSTGTSALLPSSSRRCFLSGRWRVAAGAGSAEALRAMIAPRTRGREEECTQTPEYAA